MLTPSSHAIGNAHFKMAGGWLTMVIGTVAFVALMGGLIGLTMYINYTTRGPTTTTLEVWAALLLGFQAFLLLVVGSFRIANCIRRDITSLMIESHRLMPVPAHYAVIGYIFHTNLQILAIALANALLGLSLSLAAGISSLNFILGQMVLFAFAFMIWNLTALLTFIMRYSAFAIAGALVIGSCTSIVFFAYMGLPGLALLCTPVSGKTIFSLAHGAYMVPWPYPVGMAAQLFFIIFFFLGACRRYRGTFATTFHPVVAVLIVFLWSLVSAIAAIGWADVQIHTFFGESRFDEKLFHWQVLASLASSMIICVLPLSTLLTEIAERGRGWFYTILYLLAISLAVEAVLIADVIHEFNTFQLISATSVVFSNTLTFFFLLIIFRRLTTTFASLIAIPIILAYWFLPLIIQGAYQIFMQLRPEELHLSILATLSPLGLLANDGIADNHVNPIFGLLTQWLIVVVVALLAIPRKRKIAIPPISTPPNPQPVASSPGI